MEYKNICEVIFSSIEGENWQRGQYLQEIGHLAFNKVLFCRDEWLPNSEGLNWQLMEFFFTIEKGSYV